MYITLNSWNESFYFVVWHLYTYGMAVGGIAFCAVLHCNCSVVDLFPDALEMCHPLPLCCSTSAKIQALEAKLQQMQGRGHSSISPVFKARSPKTVTKRSLALTRGRPYDLKQRNTHPPL